MGGSAATEVRQFFLRILQPRTEGANFVIVDVNIEIRRLTQRVNK
ncbi:Uncharacterised protein [Yersinia enterocolitica]|nr:Uncharacterised protein [Yersinia enterocolitica]